MRRRPGLAYDMRRGLLLAALMACAPAIVTAQSVESDVTPESAALVKSDGDFVMSSVVPDKTLEAAQYEDEHDRFSVKFGFVVMPMDYTSFDQDADSKAQVGNQQDELEARSLRLSARGHFELFRTLELHAELRVQGVRPDLRRRLEHHRFPHRRRSSGRTWAR